MIYPADERSERDHPPLLRMGPNPARRRHVDRAVPAAAAAAADPGAAPGQAADHARRLLRGAGVRGCGAGPADARAGRAGDGHIRRRCRPRGFPRFTWSPRSRCRASSHTASLRRGCREEAVDAFVETAGPDSGSPLLAGRASPVRRCASARRPTAPARCRTSTPSTCLCGIGLPMSPEMGEAINQQIDAVCDALEPWSTAESSTSTSPTAPRTLEAIFAPETPGAAARREAPLRPRRPDQRQPQHLAGLGSGVAS